MRPFTDESGKKYYRLTLLNLDHKDKYFQPYYRCLCDCGKEVVVKLTSIKTGNTQSCGCLNRELSRERLIKATLKHGKFGTRLHKIWIGMKERCQSSNNPNYKNYGRRGIAVCSEWQDFQPFYDWAMMNGYRDDLTIDRIDVNGNYEPSNCRWVTVKEQQNNKQDTIWVQFNGELLPLKYAVAKSGLPYNTVWQRIFHLGWTAEKALSTPLRGNKLI